MTLATFSSDSNAQIAIENEKSGHHGHSFVSLFIRT